MKKPNLEKITNEGFSYIKKYYFDQSLEVYINKEKRIIYSPNDDVIVMQFKKYENEKK